MCVAAELTAAKMNAGRTVVSREEGLSGRESIYNNITVTNEWRMSVC